jgi:hypothetical protein
MSILINITSSVQVLLQSGADPRLYAEDGQTPAQQSSFESIRNLLESWDVSQTDSLLQKLEAERERRRNDQQQSIDMQTKRLEDQVSAANKEYEFMQKKVSQNSCMS